MVIRGRDLAQQKWILSAYYGINVSCEHEYGGDCNGDNNQNDQPGADIGVADTDDKVGEVKR